MERQSSVGVKVFACSGIIFGIYGVIRDLLKLPNADLVRILLSFMYIFLSYSLLRLKNWSRIMLLIFNSTIVFLLTLAYIISFFLPWEKTWEIFKQEFPQFTVLGLAFFVLLSIYFYGFVIFFTRPKVKEQFKK
jgi:hypothetical protein